jgi:hypothetical protein
VYEPVAGAVNDLAGRMVDAVWAFAEGQRGAVAMMLGDYLKGVAKEMAVKSLVETAKGVAALAGIYTAGLAPGHFAAAGVAAAAAVAAGGAGIAIGAAGKGAADAQQKARDSKSAEAVADENELKELNKGTGQPTTAQRELEYQNVPVSHEEGRRNTPLGSSMGAPQVNVTVQVGTMLGDKDKRALGQDLAKIINDALSAGKRY